jgi:hypothetical protein
MEFPFPAIAIACPVCGKPCGAIYKGYYRRWVICPWALFIGFIAIRTAYCKHERRRFALFPNFLIPFRSFSREAFSRLWNIWREDQTARLIDSVDEWFHDFEREVYFAASSIHSQLRLILRQFRGAPHWFGLPPLQPGGIISLLEVSIPDGAIAIQHKAFGLATSLRINPPP